MHRFTEKPMSAATSSVTRTRGGSDPRRTRLREPRESRQAMKARVPATPIRARQTTNAAGSMPAS